MQISEHQAIIRYYDDDHHIICLNESIMKSLIPIILLLMSLLAVLPSCRPRTEPGILFGGSVISKSEEPVKMLFPGNWADPTLVKLGDIYYLTANNGRYAPSVLVFQSTNLRHWEPLCYASPLETQSPATDITAVGERLYIYGGGGMDPWVMFADPPYEVWSERINIDPLDRHPIDAVVTDMQMPGMDGVQLLAEIMKRHPDIVRIILSGQLDQEMVHHKKTTYLLIILSLLRK